MTWFLPSVNSCRAILLTFVFVAGFLAGVEKVHAACSSLGVSGNVMGVRWHADGTGTAFNVTSASVTAVEEGVIVYDSSENKLKVCDGTDWKILHSGGISVACAATDTAGGCSMFAGMDDLNQLGVCPGGIGTCSADCANGGWTNEDFSACPSACPTEVKSWGTHCSDTAQSAPDTSERSLSFNGSGSCSNCGSYYSGSALATCDNGTWNLSSTSCTSNSCECDALCFIAGTQVRMADGSTKAIEEIEVGDMVAGQGGAANEVLELFQPVKKPGHLLFALNDDHHFVTEDHPFMTTEGWKSMNPELTAVSSPQLEVGQLQVGDVLITENGKVEVKTISQKAITEATPTYNFRLSGDGMYYADGYLVSDYQGRVSASNKE